MMEIKLNAIILRT